MGLKNRIIVLDPGHGGSQEGAVGLKGLKEKDVNLRVALYLRELLKKEKADVILTREKDEEVSLDKRVQISKDANADLFLSIHHNANAQRDRTINRTEIYYPWEEESPSLDFANLLFYYFSKHFKLLTLPPLPAKYRVLRDNVEPSALGEPSYISNPAAEKKLRDKEYNKLEATIYFKSIIDYFARGIPKISDFRFIDNALSASFQDIEPSTIKLFIDNKEVPYTYDYNSKILRAPLNAGNGNHIAFLSAKNRRGNITKPCIIEFFIDNPPDDLYICFYPNSLPKRGAIPVSFFVDVVDSRGNPVCDNKLVRFKTSSGSLFFSSCFTKKGRANNFLILGEEERKTSLVIDCEKTERKKTINIKITKRSLLTGIVHNKNLPVEGAIIETKESTTVTDKDGRYYLFTVSGKTTVTLKKRGFYKTERECDIPDETCINLDIELKPIYNGILFREKIIIDPADDSFLTLDVARQIRDYLYVSGADSLLTRNSVHEKAGEVERTKFVISQDPERLISISHYNEYQKEGSRCYYYYTDKESQEFARTVQKYIVDYANRPDLGIDECSSYIIIQPHCKRTLVVPGNLSESKFRKKLENYAYRIKEAYFIFCGVLEDIGLQPEKMASLMGKAIDKEGRPLSNVSVLVFSGQRLITEEDGEFRFIYLDPGKTTLVFSKEGKGVEREITIKRRETTYTEVIL